jgi:3'-phosphoadenosine 5'-phosphosulfate sulfotransferase (PAPS reductase)/FAD synthetase
MGVIYHVGVSGGKDSSGVLIWMLNESGIPKEQIVASFCDTENEIEETYNHVRYLSEALDHPIEWLKPELGFYDLAVKKKRFPSTKARFCTQELKMKPSKEFIDNLMRAGHEVIAVSGVRADESEERSKLPEWGDPMDSYFGIVEWRPLIRWSIEDVFLIHKRYGIGLNPLYAKGAQRVGCFPCIMSRKAEIRNISKNWPERIEFLREKEQFPDGRFSSFFARNKTPLVHRTQTITAKSGQVMNVPSIDDVVAWSRTKDSKKTNQLQYAFDFWFDDETSDDAGLCPSTIGACE